MTIHTCFDPELPNAGRKANRDAHELLSTSQKLIEASRRARALNEACREQRVLSREQRHGGVCSNS